VGSNRVDMGTLFAQLGLPSDEPSITQFIGAHGPLGGGVGLHEAEFWTPSQAGFLWEAMLEDAEWAEVVDRLNSNLHVQR
jgi:hypothetical protein